MGTFLYYARALDGTILPALNGISSQQNTPTANTTKKAKSLLDYKATYPDAYLRYYESDMTFRVESETSYLVLPKIKSQIVDCFFFKTNIDTINAPIYIECKTLKYVLSSAAESETA